MVDVPADRPEPTSGAGAADQSIDSIPSMPDETIDDEDVRVAVYRRYAETGLEPTVAWLAGELGTNEEAVRTRLRRLAEQRHVVLGPDDRILMAHPFASIPMGFAVMGDHTLWWGGCAWDSFALPHLVPGEPAVLVSTTCPNCRRPLAWTVGGRSRRRARRSRTS